MIRYVLGTVYNSVLDSIIPLREDRYNRYHMLFRSNLPLDSKFFNMSDSPSFGHLVCLAHGVDYSSV